MKQLKTMFAPIITLGLSLVMASCGGGGEKQDPEVVDVCAAINGNIYLSTTLEEGGLTPEGVQLMHWQAKFADGQIITSQSDFNMAGTYTCTNGELLVSFTDVEDLLVEVSEDLETIRFNPFDGDPITYQKFEGTLNGAAGICTAVADLQFEGTYTDVSGVNQLISLGFDSGQTLTVVDGGVEYTGQLDCDMDVLHIHKSAADEAPLMVTLPEDDGLSVRKGELLINLAKVEEPVACITLYDPVCAIKHQNIQCITAPCPIGFYKTYSNSCAADVDGALVQSQGECGDLEGEPAYDPVMCTEQYQPVCAGVTQRAPCLTMPCPSVTHKTFSNRCFADADKAQFLFEGECAGLEGSPVLEIPNAACTLEVDPVCGKDESGVVCVTEPCETHVFKSFGNLCGASIAMAEVVYGGECGAIQNSPAFGYPPAVMVETLPTVSEPTSITNVRFEGDVVTMEVGYSGCDQQHFDLYISEQFMESLPVQTTIALTPQLVEDCDAYFVTEFKYDLAPLRAKYEAAYQSATGSVQIQGIGLYTF